MTDLKTPPSFATLTQLVDDQLSVRSRMGHVAVLLAALAVTVVTVILWMTEDGLPPRTHLAFAAVAVVGPSWVAYAAWVLTIRRPLLATHQVVAARMAVTFSGVFCAAGIGLAVWTPFGARALGAAALGGLMCLAALVLLRRARRRVVWLEARRSSLEHALNTPEAAR